MKERAELIKDIQERTGIPFSLLSEQSTVELKRIKRAYMPDKAYSPVKHISHYETRYEA